MPLNPLLPTALPLAHPSASTPRALVDIQIPNAVNISPTLKGINLGMVNGLSGLHALVFPYTNMDKGDEITVLFDTVPVFTSHVVNANEVFDFFIPYGAFRPGTDQIVAIQYRVVRVSTGVSEDSQPSQFRVKLTRPGGVDPSAEPQHQNLFAPVLPPHIIADGVSESDAQAGFKITIKPYQNMAYHDVIDLRWNGERLPPRLVLPTEVNGSVEIDITRSIIEAGGDGTDLEIFYRVYDEVENVSEDVTGQWWSMITKVFVHADQNALPVPTVPGAPSDELRLDSLGDNDVIVQVITYPGPFARGDEVVLTWHGLTEDGHLIDYVQTEVVTTEPPAVMTFTIPNARVIAIGGGRAHISYVVRGRASKYRTIKVIGLPVLLAAPTIAGLDGTVLPPSQIGPDGVVVHCAYARQAGDTVTMDWDGDSAFTPVAGNPGDQFVNFRVPLVKVAAYLGRAVNVKYSVMRAGVALPSAVLVLQVLPVPANSLTQLIIQQADNNGGGADLKVSAAAAATVQVGVWPLIAVGQQVWLRAEGVYADGSAYVRQEWGGGGNQANQTWINQGYYTVNFPIADIKRLKDGSSLTLTFKASLTKINDESQAVTFSQRIYTVRPMIDITPLVLDGLALRVNPDIPRPGDYEYPGNTAVRVGANGAAPYTYLSLDAAVATVNSLGVVRGKKSGATTVRVTDGAGVMAEYAVRVSNVWDVLLNMGQVNHAQARSWMNERGGRPFGAVLRGPFWRYYGAIDWAYFPEYFWTCETREEATDGLCNEGQAPFVRSNISRGCYPTGTLIAAVCVRLT